MRMLFVILTLSENTWSAMNAPNSVTNNLAFGGTSPVGVKATVI
jgi:hypothetical protein